MQSEPPDAIVLDLRMPVMDGFALLERLQNSVHTRNIPAIILSADSADRARLKALRAGATYFVEKPYKAQDLIDALERLPGTPAGRRNSSLSNRGSERWQWQQPVRDSREAIARC